MLAFWFLLSLLFENTGRFGSPIDGILDDAAIAVLPAAFEFDGPLEILLDLLDILVDLAHDHVAAIVLPAVLALRLCVLPASELDCEPVGPVAPEGEVLVDFGVGGSTMCPGVLLGVAVPHRAVEVLG